MVISKVGREKGFVELSHRQNNIYEPFNIFFLFLFTNLNTPWSKLSGEGRFVGSFADQIIICHIYCSYICRCLLLWQRCESKIWLNNAEVWEKGLGLLVLDTGVNNHIITWNPVDRSSDAVLSKLGRKE
ncbi:hypothetical protein EYC84_006525 [Monilinia fructicola]|uniref:Uncharacterized protein n=1 Tax=Monilinia fructicola TaxID=38448 RepID=A0A5M9KBW1_MONFR|nr:hypothetical protein EYC84_006525 [Monilinia fructicola]